MSYICMEDCSNCPFFFEENKTVSAKQNPTVVKENLTTEPNEVEQTENGLSVVESVPTYVVKRNIFGKEKLVQVKGE